MQKKNRVNLSLSNGSGRLPRTKVPRYLYFILPSVLYLYSRMPRPHCVPSCSDHFIRYYYYYYFQRHLHSFRSLFIYMYSNNNVHRLKFILVDFDRATTHFIRELTQRRAHKNLLTFTNVDLRCACVCVCQCTRDMLVSVCICWRVVKI